MIMVTQNKRLIGIVLAAVLLLLVPFVAMRYTDEVKWGPVDFIAAAVLLLGTGLACEFVIRKVKTAPLRIAVCGVILVMLVVIWLELAVGIIGTPFAGS